MSERFMKNKVTVEVCGKEYVLVTEENEEYVAEIAAYVHEHINETIYRNTRATKLDATVIACLDLCDRNLKLRQANDNMRVQVSEYLDEIAELNKKIAKLGGVETPPQTSFSVQ